MMRIRQITPNVFGKTGGRDSGAVRHSTSPYSMGRVVTEPIRKITKAGVGKNKRPLTAEEASRRLAQHRAMFSRPVVKGMDTQGKVLKRAKKYWMWIVAAFVAYFLFRGKR